MPIFNSVYKAVGRKSKYQEVEYIESSWTQWIDTGVWPTSDTISQIKVMFLAWTWDCVYWYCWEDNTANYRLFNWYAHSDGSMIDTWRFVFDTTHNNVYARAETGTNVSSLNTIYELEMWDFYIKNLATDTNICSWSTGTVTNTGNYTITLNNYRNTRYSQNRWYYVKIWEWATQVRNMIPCYRKSDGEIWMYDTVNSAFYTNAGTGTFTKWPDVN